MTFEFRGINGRVTVPLGSVRAIYETVLVDGAEYRGVATEGDGSCFYSTDKYEDLAQKFDEALGV